MDEEVKAEKEITSVLTSMTDDASAEAAIPKLEKAVAKARAIRSQIAADWHNDEGRKAEAERKKELGDAAQALTDALLAAIKKAPKQEPVIVGTVAKLGPR